MSQQPPEAKFRVIKTAVCPSLTAKSTLSYHIGCQENDIFFRIAANSGGGYFNPDWISLKTISSAIEAAPKPLTSSSLTPLFTGRSINTPSFLFALLLAEGLVQRDPENPRTYLQCVPRDFKAAMDVLMTSDVDLKVGEEITGKGAIKNKQTALAKPEAASPKSAKKQDKIKAAAKPI